jgi:hypothetical protein
MLNKSITIGIANPDMKKVKDELESLLNIKLEEHESSYLGRYFTSKMLGAEEFELSNNFIDEDWSEANFKDYILLLRFNASQQPEKITDTILNNVNNSVFIKALETKTGEYLKVYDFIDGQFVKIREKNLK